jgi:hypothetical protein
MSGPIFPYSAVPSGSTGEIFPNVHVGATNSRLAEGLGVANATDLTADRTWMLHFQMPPTLPSGTAKLRLLAIANATTGVAKVNPTWGSVAVEENYDTTTLTAEGVQTVTWETGDADVFKELKVTLDADTVVASEIVVMNLVFVDTDFTLAVTSTWIASIIWE